jgi:lysyl-tRNA synthetase, class II
MAETGSDQSSMEYKNATGGYEDDRRAKLERLRQQGIDPFPYRYEDPTPVARVHEAHTSLESGEETQSVYRVAGRLAAHRRHGRAAFLDLVDRSGRLQLHARSDVLESESFQGLVGLDLGDLIGVTGRAFRSQRGELSLLVDDWVLLAKSLRPPPEKFHGLEDVETRYRQRELDLLANESTRELFVMRSRIIAAIRRWLDERGFLEVETPVLQPLYGGALARPFTTHHNALGRDLYLRIATELYLKRLIVGGLERVYELGKDFRNEGISQKHNPEFTMLEWYEAYADYQDVAQHFEQLVAFVADSVDYSGDMDFTPPWRRLTLQEAILNETGVDILAHRNDGHALAQAASERGIDLDGDHPWPLLVDELLSRCVEPRITQPTFVMDFPVELSPFAKKHRSQPGLVERFECFAGGIELANAFTELNDPDEQRERFLAQSGPGDQDGESQPYDEDFVWALDHGMPPTGGIGMGIDRLVMLLSGRGSIREVVLFPAMRS